MKNKLLILSSLTCLAPVVLSAIVYDRLPEQVAVHFDYAGNPDGYLPKAAAAFGMPVVFFLINLFVHFRLNQEPKKGNISVSLSYLFKWLVPFMSVLLVPVTLYMSMGTRIPISMIGSAMVGVVVMISGNYLPKCKRNYTMGIKLPWTLDNEDNWNKTHRFAGFLWVIGGFAIMLSAFLATPYTILGIVAFLVLAPGAYSFALYHSQKKGEQK